MNLTLTKDTKLGIFYLTISKKNLVKESISTVSTNIVIDYDESDGILGIEFLNGLKFIDSAFSRRAVSVDNKSNKLIIKFSDGINLSTCEVDALDTINPNVKDSIVIFQKDFDVIQVEIYKKNLLSQSDITGIEYIGG